MYFILYLYPIEFVLNKSVFKFVILTWGNLRFVDAFFNIQNIRISTDILFHDYGHTENVGNTDAVCLFTAR